MACHAAITDHFLTVTEDETIEKTLKALQKKKVEIAVVVDEKGKLLGMFSYKILLANSLPVNVAMAGGTFAMDAAPGVAKRLRKAKPLPVKNLMKTDVKTAYPETPTWEGLKYVLESAHPVIVIDRESKKPLGIITEHSLFDEFERMQEE